MNLRSDHNPINGVPLTAIGAITLEQQRDVKDEVEAAKGRSHICTSSCWVNVSLFSLYLRLSWSTRLNKVHSATGSCRWFQPGKSSEICSSRHQEFSPPVNSLLRFIRSCSANVGRVWFNCGRELVRGEYPWWRNDPKPALPVQLGHAAAVAKYKSGVDRVIVILWPGWAPQKVINEYIFRLKGL